VNLESVYRVINWQAVVLIASILPLATALNKTGVTRLISVGLVDTLGELGPFAMLATIFLITAATGLFISNTATAVLIAPIAIDAALTIGVSPYAFAMTVAIACSAAYVTPVSSPVNTLILDPGGYTFMDFVKVGLPLQLLTLIVTVALAGVIYDF
jgi:di/tricarboxylate transporter